MRHRTEHAWNLGAALPAASTAVPQAPFHGALRLPGYVDLVDLSEFQAQVDYGRLAAAGFSGAIVRASLGPSYVDRRAAAHLAGVRGAGMIAMVYVAAQPQKGAPRDQARRALDGMGEIYTRCFLDLESRGGLSNAELVDFACVFADEILLAGALRPGFYSYPWFEATLNPDLASSDLAMVMDLWQAYIGGPEPWVPSWGDAPKIPKPWTRGSVWQYSGDRGYRVPGIAGPCDRDLFVGTLDDLKRFVGLTPERAAPDDDPTGPSLTFDIDLEDEDS